MAMSGSNDEERTAEQEKRLERVVERLFSTPATLQATSSPSLPPSVPVSPFMLNGSALQSNSKPRCNPEDKSDLQRRLRTFKSTTWFGKPLVAGPVACARRGWINKGEDLISCEFCGAFLSFVSDSLSRQQLDQAANVFSKKLATDHKHLCPWKQSVCPESLADFPATSNSVLVQGYNERMDALSTLAALPRISSSALEQIRSVMASELDLLVSTRADITGTDPTDEEMLKCARDVQDEYHAYCQAQKVISLCGWSTRILHYTYKDNSVGLVGSKRKRSSSTETASSDATDPTSVVLECSLCGASVGLWSFTTVSRSVFEAAKLISSAIRRFEGGQSSGQCSEVPAESNRADEHVENRADEPVVPESPEKAIADDTTQRVPGLDLNLTIAGGPRPTRLSYAPHLSPAYIPIPGLERQAEPEKASSVNKDSDVITVLRLGNLVEAEKPCSIDESSDERAGKTRRLERSMLPSNLDCGDKFDPVHQHRYFCPWTNSSTKPCGWQLTLKSLLATGDVQEQPVLRKRVEAGSATHKLLSKDKGKAAL